MDTGCPAQLLSTPYFETETLAELVYQFCYVSWPVHSGDPPVSDTSSDSQHSTAATHHHSQTLNRGGRDQKSGPHGRHFIGSRFPSPWGLISEAAHGQVL